MPLKIQSPQAWYQNYKHKQAAKKGRMKQHDVDVSDTSQGVMETPTKQERLEQTPVSDRHTEKRDIKRPILQVTTQGQGQDQELLDALMPRPRPAGAPPAYDEAVKHSGDTNTPSSPPPEYGEHAFPVSTSKLKKQTKAAIKAFEKADKELTSQRKKVADLEKEYAEKLEKKGTEKAAKIDAKVKAAKEKLAAEETRCKKLEQEKKAFETAFESAIATDIDEGNTEHKSLLASAIKPWLTLNKEELSGLQTRKDFVTKEHDKAKASHQKCQKAYDDLIAKLKKETKAANKASHKTAGQSGGENLHEKIKAAQTELDTADTILATHKQQLTAIEAEVQEAEKNSDSLVDFAVGFATNLRAMHKLRKKDGAIARAELAKLQSFTVPRLVVDTDDGKIQVDNLKLKLKSLDFKQNAAKQWVPVLGIESMTGQISVPMPDSQSIKVALDLKDVTVDLDAGFGNPLHSYVTSNFAITGLGSALMGLPKAIASMLPRHITARGKRVGIELKGFSAATMAAAAHKGQATPRTAPDILFEALGLGIDAELEEISVSTRGGATLDGIAKGAVVQYNPDPLKKGQNSTTRKVHLAAKQGSLSISDGLPLVEGLLKELEITDPMSLISGMTSSKDPTSLGKLKSLSEKLHFEVTSPDITLSRELHKKVVTKKWGGLRKQKGWTLTGANTLDAKIKTFKVSNAGDLRASAIVKELELSANPIRYGGNKFKAAARHAALDINSPTTLLSSEGALVQAGILSEGVDVTGKVRLSMDNPQISGQASETQQSATLTLPELKANIEEKTTVFRGNNGLILPKALNLTVQGEVNLKHKDELTTVTPEFRLRANDRRGTLFVQANGKKIPVDLKAEVSLHKAPYHVLSYNDEGTGQTVSTPVITEGGLTVEAPKIGPMKMGNLSLHLDKKGNGKVRANDIEVDLASLATGDKVHFLNGPGEEASVVISDDPVPWYAKPLLANKRLHLSAEAGIKRGQVNLKDLKAFKLKFTNTRHAGPLDRVITAVLNLGSGFISRRLQNCQISHQITETTDPGAKEAVVTKPCITVKVWPIKRTYPLKIPHHWIDPENETISATRALHENTGLIVVQQSHLTQILDGIKQIKLGKKWSISSLKELCLKFDQAHDGVEAIHLLAEQFPIEHARQILRDCKEKKRPQIERALNSCANIFVAHPRLQNQAIRIFQLTGYKPTEKLIKQMGKDIAKNPNADPTGLATLTLQKDSDQAIELFKLALQRNMSTAIAHTRLGCALLKQASPASKSANGSKLVRNAMEHLMKGALEGNSEAMETISNTENSSDAEEMREARLAHATLLLKQEQGREDFYRAIEKLEFLALQTGKTRELAEKLLKGRFYNARQIFHTEDEKAFDKTQESVKKLRNDIRVKRQLPTGKKAYDLGIKLLYGADGAPRDTMLAATLLQRATDIPAAQVHLKAAGIK